MKIEERDKEEMSAVVAVVRLVYSLARKCKTLDEFLEEFSRTFPEV